MSKNTTAEQWFNSAGWGRNRGEAGYKLRAFEHPASCIPAQ